ncbi:MAG: TIR domain-containing protein [Bacteroidales bacterium]|nr:TIR domain-containing protein [Bacteroidales bacterium]
MKKYDIFISYRRSSYDTANLIATRLRSAGYSVFFDMETLRSGKFNVQLYEVIDNCKDFLLVLPPNALDRCVNEDDWVRLEVLRAMGGDKNIIPIMLNGFTWPNPMPIGMEELCNYQAVTASSVEYFDLSMEKLQKRYLHSKKQLPIVKLLKYVGVFIFTLLALLGIAWGVFVSLSKDVCLKYATALTKDASYVHIIAEENDKLVKDWEEFNNAMNYETKPERIAVMQENMEKRIDVVEKNLKQMWNVDSTKMEISSYHSFLLSIYGINAEEISVSPQFATLYYNDYLGQIELLRNAVREPNTLNRRYSTALFEVFKHFINSYYASILSELSNFPESSLTTYNEMSKLWTYFPVMYKLGEDEKYYEDIINNETKQAEDLMTRFESVLEYNDAKMEDIERKNDAFEKQIEDLSNLQSQVDSAAEIVRAVTEIENIKKQNESELAIRKEKVAAKKVALDATKAELEELDKQYVEAYENLKKKCTLDDSDDQWYKWGKIRRWGNFLSMLVESRRSLKSQGIYSTSSVTPDVAYADMNSLLTVYQTYHPESKSYVASAKRFYCELSKDQRRYAGVIIFGFKDDAIHPYFKQGDIVVEYDGKEVKNYNSFKSAYKANNNGEVVFLRLNGSGFDEIKEQIKDTDIIGFLELTE